jgi:hypothetical protein
LDCFFVFVLMLVVRNKNACIIKAFHNVSFYSKILLGLGVVKAQLVDIQTGSHISRLLYLELSVVTNTS